MKVRLFVMLALSAVLFAAVAPGAEAASTSSRLAKLEKAVKSLQAQNAALVNADAGLRSRLTTDEQAIGSMRSQLNSTGNLLLNCFQSTSMGLGLAPDWLAPFNSGIGYLDGHIVPALAPGPDGPFYMAMIRPSCVGAVTPPIPAAAAVAGVRAKGADGGTMFPTAPLPFPAVKR